MDNSNAKIKQVGFGNTNSRDKYIEEIPVKNMSGEFFVVAGATRGNNADSNAETTRIGRDGIDGREGEQKLSNLPREIGSAKAEISQGKEIRNWKKQTAKLPPPSPMVLRRRDAINRVSTADPMKKNIAPFIISAEDEEETNKLVGKEDSKQDKAIQAGDGDEKKLEIKKLEIKGKAQEETGEVPGALKAPGTEKAVERSKEPLKIREIEREKGNSGVNISDIIKKREEVEREVGEKVEEIINRIKNYELRIKNGEEAAQKLEIGNWKFERFKNLLKTRIKGSRNNAQLFEALTKKEEEGGMGMAEEEADSVVKIVSGILNHESGIMSYEASEETGEKESDSLKESDSRKEGKEGENRIKNLELKIKKEERKEGGEGGKKLDPSDERPSHSTGCNGARIRNLKLAGEGKEEIKKLEEEKEGRTQEIKKLEIEKLEEDADKVSGALKAPDTEKATSFYAINRMASDSGKPKIEDIKHKSKLTGPVEEIASFRVKDFRQLSDDPIKAAEMIKNKIDILEDDSFAKKIEGIKAWRSSEIYKAYLEMGQRAIEQKLEIRNLKLGENSLTEEEFYAIMDLNKKLRF